MPALRKIFMMIHFPTTITDNFFDDPWYVIDLANRVDYKPSSSGNWPGVRSESLEVIDKEFFNYFIKRFYLQFYDYEYITSGMFGVRAQTYFQKITGEEQGWIHSDYPHTHTIINYLTPGARADTGTCLYKKRNEDIRDDLQETKLQYYRGNVSKEVADEARELHNEQFIEDTRVGNIFNRCVAFDSQLWHGAQGFDSKEERLTMITFVTHVICKGTPLAASRSMPFIREGR